MARFMLVDRKVFNSTMVRQMANKLVISIVIGITFMVLNSAAHAALLFSEDFSDLSDWKSVHGQIVSDPTDTSNTVLNFNHTNSWGDTFSPLLNNTDTRYWLTLDYYSTDPTNANGGGFIGIDPNGFKDGNTSGDGGPNGTHIWLIGTPAYGNLNYLPQSNSSWKSAVFSFTVPQDWHTFSMMFEDFRGVSGDAYFDNIKVFDSYPVPEPASLILFGLGLISLTGLGLKKRKLAKAIYIPEIPVKKSHQNGLN